MEIGRYYRLNQNITAKKVRLIDEQNKLVGIVDLSQALERARKTSLDLVEIAQKADPPVVKIVDFKKFKYDEARKERATRKKTREVSTKEIWLSPTISDHDLDIRLSRAKKFLQTGDRVKLTVKFAGRKITHPQLGYNILTRSFENLAEIGEKDSEPKMAGRRLSVNIKPAKKGANEAKNKEDSSKTNKNN